MGCTVRHGHASEQKINILKIAKGPWQVLFRLTPVLSEEGVIKAAKGFQRPTHT
jgi:hypothetical protein